MDTRHIATTALPPFGHPSCNTEGIHFSQRSTPHKDGHASHCHNATSAHRASILQHGRITLHTAFHSAQGWTRFTLPQRHFRPSGIHSATRMDYTSHSVLLRTRMDTL